MSAPNPHAPDHVSRKSLPDFRPAVTHKAYVCGFKIYVTVTFFDEPPGRARPAEIFIAVAKQGSMISGVLNTLAALASVSLQHGVPWPAIEAVMRHHCFERNGDEVNTSIVDGFAKAISLCIDHRAKIIGEDEPPTAGSGVPAPTPMAPPSLSAKAIEFVKTLEITAKRNPTFVSDKT